MEVEQSCIICDQHKMEGIHIYDSFICSECEQEMVVTDVVDLKYSFFIKRLKRIWLKKDA